MLATKKTKPKTRKKPETKPRKRGQPTSYKASYVSQAHYVCKDKGFTDVDLAKLFGVTKTTIANWKNDYPEFFDAIKRGKWEYENVKVEASLLKRVHGYEYEEVKTVIEKITDESGATVGKVRQRIEKPKKHIPPDTACIIFWKCNRQPQDWQNTQRINVRVGDSDTSDINSLTTKDLIGIINSNGNGSEKKKKDKRQSRDSKLKGALGGRGTAKA